jgi:hypothetical protein
MPSGTAGPGKAAPPRTSISQPNGLARRHSELETRPIAPVRSRPGVGRRLPTDPSSPETPPNARATREWHRGYRRRPGLTPPRQLVCGPDGPQPVDQAAGTAESAGASHGRTPNTCRRNSTAPSRSSKPPDCCLLRCVRRLGDCERHSPRRTDYYPNRIANKSLRWRWRAGRRLAQTPERGGCSK